MLQNLLRTLNSFSKTTVLLICCCCLGCGNGEKEIDDPDRPDRPDGDEYEDIEVVDGKVRFERMGKDRKRVSVYAEQ